MKFRYHFLLLVALAGVSVLSGCSKKEPSSQAAGTPAANVAVPAAPFDKVTIQMAGVNGVTVLDLLQRSHEVYSKSTVAGQFVTGIDSMKAGADAGWVYSVNDTFPNVAADKMVTRNGDKVVWHLRMNK